MKTGDILKAMLTENTGTHMLDSGGASGRAWQENQERDFASEPAATLTVEEGYIDIRRSTFHFLVECLEFDEAMDKRFQAFNRAKDPGDQIGWLVLMEEFAESIEATGIYGEGDPITVNIYNHDSLLDQVIQYVYFELDEKGYVLLQIHGGCDVRGGYTAPKAFRCNIESSPSIFSDGEAAVICKGGDHRWYVQEGDWDTSYQDESTDERRGLDKFPIITDEAKYQELCKVAKLGRAFWPVGLPYSEFYQNEAFGVIWQDSDGVHCPLCGNILEVW